MRQSRKRYSPAFSAAGPVGDDREAWDAHVAEMASEITLSLVSPSSRVRKAIEAITDADKRFVCVVERVQKEAKSTRGFITVKTRPSKWAPNGQESFRTDRSEGDPAARALAKRFKDLIGHKVLAYLHMEETKDGAKVRVVKAVVDLGAATGDEFEQRAA
ncbi:hypothetical protein LEP48_09695 [Isoptericola sp. NEAU-Y5]|uniref:Uncharacterized protein n=1 Tax=Isoptericola luteus TaxID=2879484 RepID=A0ABS7ZF06_9MICO|nr:hypothetical protein [Isoptericola sp. NEAU-Y5]MCA5893621.1 hypothetical protein [Isoptericola sp. NEAU-Y5]